MEPKKNSIVEILQGIGTTIVGIVGIVLFLGLMYIDKVAAWLMP